MAGLDIREIVGWCDLEGSADSAPSDQGSFMVREYAVLADGREVTLLDDRGWSGRVNGGSFWEWQTAEGIEVDVLNVVLPDNAEETGDEHEWAWFVDRLAAEGVAASVEDLCRVPYRIVLSDRILARLGDRG